MIISYKGVRPVLGNGVFVAQNATIIGDVVMGDECGVWFGTVVRGDVNIIRLGAQTNIQDNSTLHVTTARFPLHIGNRVTVGHRALLHGCTIGDDVLVGMGAIVMDGAQIGDKSIVAAGALVPEGAKFPPNSVIMGLPAKRVRDVSPAELERITSGAKDYVELAREYLKCQG